jgi:hypothetical protein
MFFRFRKRQRLDGCFSERPRAGPRIRAKTADYAFEANRQDALQDGAHNSRGDLKHCGR